MTPNPNPSPELRETVEAEVRKLKGADSPWAIGIRERLRAALALSPQTLPAPGEVLAWRYTRPNKLYPALPGHVVVEAPENRWDNVRSWTETPLYALATVAAANDEGVAEAARRLEDARWTPAGSKLDQAIVDPDDIATVLALIRLPSRGEGK